MDLEKLRCCVSLSRHLNFTRAAEENFISQPSMTQKINSLEQELGVQLFRRSNREVSLTEAGRSFVQDAQAILLAYQDAVLRAQSIQAREPASLTLGYAGLNAGEFLPALLERFHAVHPGVGLRMRKDTLNGLNRRLLAGEADMIFSNQFEMARHPEFQGVALFETTPCVILPLQHPLAKREKLTLADLRGERLLASSCAEAPDEFNGAANALHQAGVPYEPSGLVYDEDVIISMVEAGLGLYPSAKWYHSACREKVACVDLELDVDNMQIIIAWRKSDHRPVLQDFVDIAQRYFAGEDFQLPPPCQP